jgi:hypothetical protein
MDTRSIKNRFIINKAQLYKLLIKLNTAAILGSFLELLEDGKGHRLPVVGPPIHCEPLELRTKWTPATVVPGRREVLEPGADLGPIDLTAFKIFSLQK